MSERAVIAVDVGGTTIDTACVSADGEIIAGPLESSSPAAWAKCEIIAELARVINTARARVCGADVTACGVAIPGPFDCVAGVSYMVHKFQAIHGVPLGELLRAETGLPAYFVNDADAFGLGVSWRQLPDTKRFVALTIGTGLGVSFIEDGGNVQVGEVWNLPCGDGILEDRVSARGVVSLYGSLSPGHRSAMTAKEVSALALGGDDRAVQAYRAMGAVLGDCLAPVLGRFAPEKFAPEKIVIGGKVGQSLELFRPAMQQALAEAGLGELPVIPAAPGNMAIWGAASYPLMPGALTAPQARRARWAGCPAG